MLRMSCFLVLRKNISRPFEDCTSIVSSAIILPLPITFHENVPYFCFRNFLQTNLMRHCSCSEATQKRDLTTSCLVIQLTVVILCLEFELHFKIVSGRLFDYHMLDMIELGISDFKSMSEFPVC